MNMTNMYKGRFQIPESLLGGSGLVDGVGHENVIGRNPATTSTDEALWDGSTAFNYRTTDALLNLSSSDATDTDIAVGILTLSGNILDGETVTIDEKIYTFEDTLTEVDGNVHIGALATDTIDNLIDAINLGAGGGTDYATAMTLHPSVTALAGAGDTMDITAKVSGVEVATTETSDTASWATVTTLLGVGVRSVEVFGEDIEHNRVNEVVFLDGEAAVATVNSYLRVFKLKSKAVGSDGDNAGDIYISTGALSAGVPDEATEIFGKILVGRGKTASGVYTIPAGHVGYISKVSFQSGLTGTQHVDAKIMVREENESFYVFDEGQATREGGNLVLDYSDGAEPIPAKADIELRVSASAGAPVVRGSISLFLVQDPNVNTG